MELGKAKRSQPLPALGAKSTTLDIDRKEVVLLFSESFQDGILLSRDGFITFLKHANRLEVVYAEYTFLSQDESVCSDFDFLMASDVRAELLGSMEVH